MSRFPGVDMEDGEDGGDMLGVYISDAHGEIVMWTWEEVAEDPSAWMASMVAVGLAAQGKFEEIRKIVGKEIPVLDRLAKETE